MYSNPSWCKYSSGPKWPLNVCTNPNCPILKKSILRQTGNWWWWWRCQRFSIPKMKIIPSSITKTKIKNLKVSPHYKLLLFPSALPLSTRLYDATRVPLLDTLSLWRALMTPWQTAQKTSTDTTTNNTNFTTYSTKILVPQRQEAAAGASHGQQGTTEIPSTFSCIICCVVSGRAVAAVWASKIPRSSSLCLAS